MLDTLINYKKTDQDYELLPYEGELQLCEFDFGGSEKILTINMKTHNDEIKTFNVREDCTLGGLIFEFYNSIETHREYFFRYKNLTFEQSDYSKRLCDIPEISNQCLIYCQLKFHLIGGGHYDEELLKFEDQKIKIFGQYQNKSIKEIEIIIKHTYGIFKCFIFEDYTISQLKSLISEMTQIKKNDLKLCYQDKELSENILVGNIEEQQKIQQQRNKKQRSIEISLFLQNFPLIIITNEKKELKYLAGYLKNQQEYSRLIEEKNQDEYIFFDLKKKKPINFNIEIHKQFQANDQIVILKKENGGDQLKFNHYLNHFIKEIYNSQINKLEYCLKFLNNSTLNLFLNQQRNKIQKEQNKSDLYKKFDIDEILAIKLYTSNLIYRQMNQDMRTNNFAKWGQYLHILNKAILKCPYYTGIVYRGIKNYQPDKIYFKGKLIQWHEFSSLTKSQKVAQKFQNQKGTLFEIYVNSGRDISQLSCFQEEEEVIMLPYSQYEVLKLEQLNCYNIKLQEIPTPRFFKVILWVDDCQQNNYNLIQECEQLNKEISFMFCKSTQEAIHLFQMNKWLTFLGTNNLKIITDMVRYEDGKQNFLAGAEFIKEMQQKFNYKNPILIFTMNIQQSQKNCEKLKIVPPFLIKTKVQDIKQFILK